MPTNMARLSSDGQDALATLDLCSKHIGGEARAPYDRYLNKWAELFEIIHHAVLLLYDRHHSPNSFADRVGIHNSGEDKELHEIALHFDSCLSRWEQDLPPQLRLEAISGTFDERCRLQAVALRLR